MTEKLKPCPFCGSENVEVFKFNIDFAPGKYGVHCNDCEISVGRFNMEDDVIKGWNQRGGKLKPCPFCGSEDVETARFALDGIPNKTCVFCHNCKTFVGRCKTELDAIKKWNRRA